VGGIEGRIEGGKVSHSNFCTNSKMSLKNVVGHYAKASLVLLETLLVPT
jgi:hypothetical protein